jgi:hypothetical protein
MSTDNNDHDDAPPTMPLNPRVKVVLEHALIQRGGDVGAAEIYFEGWVDDGAGNKRTFRIPHAGHIPGVKDGQTIKLDTMVFESVGPVGAALTVHVEAWDEDLGRDSLVNPDDLLGTYEHAFTGDANWGRGQHKDISLKTNDGAWQLTFRIE